MYDTLAALDRATVDEVLDKYSWLAKSDDSFLEEFKRIEDIGIAKEVLHFLDRYCNAIRTLCKPKIKDSERSRVYIPSNVQMLRSTVLLV